MTLKKFFLMTVTLCCLASAPLTHASAEEKSPANAPRLLKDGEEIQMEFSKRLEKKEDYTNYSFILNQTKLADQNPIFNVGEFTLEDGTKYVFAAYEEHGVAEVCDTPGCPFLIFMNKGAGYQRAMYIDLKQELTQTIFRKTKEGLSVLFCEMGGARGEATWELDKETFKLTGVKRDTPTCPDES